MNSRRIRANTEIIQAAKNRLALFDATGRINSGASIQSVLDEYKDYSLHELIDLLSGMSTTYDGTAATIPYYAASLLTTKWVSAGAGLGTSTSDYCLSLDYIREKEVLIGGSHYQKLKHSYNATTWTQQSVSGVSGSMFYMQTCYSPELDLFVGCGARPSYASPAYIRTSTGIPSWTIRNLTTVSSRTCTYSCAWNPLAGVYIVGSTNSAWTSFGWYRSSDGYAYTSGAGNAVAAQRYPKWMRNNGFMIMPGSGTTIMRSFDCLDWETVDTGFTVVGTSGSAVEIGTTIYMMGTNSLLISDDGGDTWRQTALSFQPRWITYSPELDVYLIGGNGGTICYSHDLVTFINVVVNTTSGNICREGYWFPPAGKFVLNYRTGQVASGLSSLDLLGS